MNIYNLRQLAEKFNCKSESKVYQYLTKQGVRFLDGPNNSKITTQEALNQALFGESTSGVVLYGPEET